MVGLGVLILALLEEARRRRCFAICYLAERAWDEAAPFAVQDREESLPSVEGTRRAAYVQAMAELRLLESGIVLDGQTITLGETTAAEISATLGATPRVSKLRYNTVCTWDGVGLYAYCAPRTEHVGTLAMAIEPESLDFCPKAHFAGTILWEDRSFDIATEASAWCAFVKGEAKRQKVKSKRGSTLVSLRLGPLAIPALLDATRARVTGVQIAAADEAKAEAEVLPPIEVPKGEGVAFVDLNFKLLVLQELMYRRNVLTPRLDVYELAKRHRAREILIDREGYAIIPEVRAFFERYPVPAALLRDIASLGQEGGDEIYLQIFPSGTERITPSTCRARKTWRSSPTSRRCASSALRAQRCSLSSVREGSRSSDPRRALRATSGRPQGQLGEPRPNG